MSASGIGSPGAVEALDRQFGPTPGIDQTPKPEPIKAKSLPAIPPMPKRTPPQPKLLQQGLTSSADGIPMKAPPKQLPPTIATSPPVVEVKSPPDTPSRSAQLQETVTWCRVHGRGWANFDSVCKDCANWRRYRNISRKRTSNRFHKRLQRIAEPWGDLLTVLEESEERREKGSRSEAQSSQPTKAEEEDDPDREVTLAARATMYSSRDMMYYFLRTWRPDGEDLVSTHVKIILGVIDHLPKAPLCDRQERPQTKCRACDLH